MGTIARTVKDASGKRDSKGFSVGTLNPALAIKKMADAFDKIEEGHTCTKMGRCDVCSAIMDLDFELRGV